MDFKDVSKLGNYGESSSTLIGIPSNLLKNFNIHETLQPMKIQTITSKDSNNDDLLINFDDSHEHKDGMHSFRLRNGLRENEDTGFNIIDAFQNIYVNPEQIGTKWEIDIDYDDFCRKQTSRKSNEWTNNTHLDQRKTKNFDHQIDFESTFDKVVENEFGKTEKLSYTDEQRVVHSDALDDEDLIDELLLDRSIMKTKFSNVKNLEHPHTVKVLKTPPILRSNVISKNTALFKEEHLKNQQNITMNHEEASASKHFYLKNGVSTQHEKLDSDVANGKKQCKINQAASQVASKPSKAKLDDAMVSKFLKTMECNDFKFKNTQSNLKSHISDKIPSSNNVFASLHKNDKPNPTPLSSLNKDELAKIKEKITKKTQNNSLAQSDMATLINATINPERMIALPIQPVLKDNKAKYRYVEGAMEFTKGPDLHEKAIVLPQILERLSIQKRAFDESLNIKRRLKLDAGNVINDNFHKVMEGNITLDPTVLMEDCNKERLIALKARQMINTLVRSGGQPNAH